MSPANLQINKTTLFFPLLLCKEVGLSLVLPLPWPGSDFACETPLDVMADILRAEGADSSSSSVCSYSFHARCVRAACTVAGDFSPLWYP